MDGRKRISIIIAASLALLVAAFALVVLLPQGTLAEPMDGASRVRITAVRTDTQARQVVELTPQDPAFSELEQILKGYKWRRCIHSGDAGMQAAGETWSVVVQIWQGDAVTDLTFTGKKHILADGKPLRLDAFGGKKARRVLDEVLALLENE